MTTLPKSGTRSLSAKITGLIKAATLTVCLLAAHQADAQFSFQLGGSLTMSNEKAMNFADERPTVINGNMTEIGDTSYYAYKYSAGGYGIYAYPKYTFRSFRQFGISVGTPVNLGFSGGSNEETSFLLDISAAIDLNGGSYSQNEKALDAPFGYFVGVGLGFTNTNGIGYELDNTGTVSAGSADLVHINGRETDPVSHLSAKSVGLLFQAGIGSITALGDMVPYMANAGLRVAYKPSLSNKKLSYLSIALTYDF